MTCENCARDLNRFNPACLMCGARYLRDVQQRAMPAEEKRAWLRHILSDWQEFGHAEADLRAQLAALNGKRPQHRRA